MSKIKKDVELAKDKKFDITKFETLEVSGQILKSGFSVAHAAVMGGMDVLNSGCNNCNGGNCAVGCACSAKQASLQPS